MTAPSGHTNETDLCFEAVLPTLVALYANPFVATVVTAYASRVAYEIGKLNMKVAGLPARMTGLILLVNFSLIVAIEIITSTLLSCPYKNPEVVYRYTFYMHTGTMSLFLLYSITPYWVEDEKREVIDLLAVWPASRIIWSVLALCLWLIVSLPTVAWSVGIAVIDIVTALARGGIAVIDIVTALARGAVALCNTATLVWLTWFVDEYWIKVAAVLTLCYLVEQSYFIGLACYQSRARARPAGGVV